MATQFQQAQAEGLCLRYPESLGMHATVDHDNATNMLLRAISLSQQVPFSWGFIDRPQEGQLLLLFLPPQSPFPIDGIRYLDQETKYSIPVGSSSRVSPESASDVIELEVHEVKLGFIPGSQDTNAWRLRRRFRLTKGGHPQLVLVHYTRGPVTQINPALLSQPIRSYPLRPINEPAVYVMGDKAGQKIFPHGAPPGAPQPGMQPGMSAAMGMGVNMPFNRQAMVAQQNTAMDSLERRRATEREREQGRNRSASNAAGAPRPPRVDDDDSGDDTDQISTRTLAMTRYKRNHDLMNEVFRYAALGNKNAPIPKRPYSIFDKTELEDKAVKLQAEIDVLQARAAERRSARLIAEETANESTSLNAADVSMEILGEGITV